MARKRERGFPDEPEPLPVPVADNHTHLESIAGVLPDDVPAPSVAEHVARAAVAGVDRIVQVGCDLPSARWTDALLRSGEHPAIVGAVAIHPNEAVLHADAHDVGPDGQTYEREPHHHVPLDEAIAEIAGIARANPGVRAIGETGLDHFRTGDRGAAVQRESFRAHLAVARELDLPVQIHDRDAHAQVIDVLLADGAPARTVFHCFSGDVQMAELAAEHGWYLSFAGPVTYRANQHLRDALRAVPLEQVLVETDAPYLTPHPFRGRPNAPYVVAHTVRALAEVLERPLDQVCATLSTTSDEVYGPW
ncbi:TatD-related deoxyribonuclease [Xylanimonas cellulosilytica DSM 15894]|uniref:TatD-related deoxyribonuclease n=1 Tax=Xylanimonas cellulosilytica (strain DSM 15894 / JCM 12276 / CECT 5975 / KCTC 9989 / LMG 20990 / NBRC 107835 / XIL07) TaxID=446471 RepID=D1BXV3_XYLCX|nr:TatD family hydrolase [Xylanimonas cellulosilytica]ACZ31744.1 TatD-related deoxyribonuclease [Xylanimonas cellulosilytica DSM 15894]